DPDLLSGLDEADQGLLSASGGDEGYLSLREGYRVDETAALKTAAREIIGKNLASAVVMGHTHEPVEPEADLNYVNIGSWTRYLDASRCGSQQRSWDLLQKSAFENFPYELAYGELTSDAPGQLARRVFRP